MSISEFDLIRQYFATQPVIRADTVLGIGDDAAIVQPFPSQQIVLTTDTLVQGVHFSETTSAEDIGYKALAVNLSDLAAMGAEPAWVLLTISLPKPDTTWLAQFCAGFYALAQAYQVQLIGGDTSYSPILSITVQLIGTVPPGQALRRSGAQPGDLIYVTGSLGGAGLALQLLQQGISPVTEVLNRLNRPEPCIAQGLALRQIATSAIDISDGLAADLAHILRASAVGATLEWARLPIYPALDDYLTPEVAWQLALTHGDDYELCFTVPAERQSLLEHHDCLRGCKPIGRITEQPNFLLQMQDGSTRNLWQQPLGYQHFGN